MFKNKSLNKVINKVLEDNNTSWDEIKSSRRTEAIVNARFISYYLSRKFTNLSYTQIGHKFDKDHSTIMHGCKKAEVLDKNILTSYVDLYHTYLEDTKESRDLLEDSQRNSVLTLMKSMDQSLAVLIDHVSAEKTLSQQHTDRNLYILLTELTKQLSHFVVLFSGLPSYDDDQQYTDQHHYSKEKLSSEHEEDYTESDLENRDENLH